MLIKDKKGSKVYNLANIVSIGVFVDEVRVETILNKTAIIGTYSTPLKAEKALKRLLDAVESVHYETVASDRCGTLFGNVFQMPQDNEV